MLVRSLAHIVEVWGVWMEVLSDSILAGAISPLSSSPQSRLSSIPSYFPSARLYRQVAYRVDIDHRSGSALWRMGEIFRTYSQQLCSSGNMSSSLATTTWNCCVTLDNRTWSFTNNYLKWLKRLFMSLSECSYFVAFFSTCLFVFVGTCMRAWSYFRMLSDFNIWKSSLKTWRGTVGMVFSHLYRILNDWNYFKLTSFKQQ